MPARFRALGNDHLRARFQRPGQLRELLDLADQSGATRPDACGIGPWVAKRQHHRRRHMRLV